MKINTYFIPPIAYDIEMNIPKDELVLDGHTLMLPRLTAEHVLDIIRRIRDIHESFLEYSDEYIKEIFMKVLKKWQDPNYDKRKIAIELLPKYTNYSKEILEFYQFKILDNVRPELINIADTFEKIKSGIYNFSTINEENLIIKAFGSIIDKFKVKRMNFKTGSHKILTLLSPPNAIGLIAMYGIWIGIENRSGVIIKNPRCQPFFAALIAESIFEVDKELANMIFVLPWYKRDDEIDNIIFKNSDSIIVALENKLNTSGDFCRYIKKKARRSLWITSNVYLACHGGRVSFDIISKEYVNEDIAKLAVIDGFGYEGRMNPAPVLGFFVEEGGEATPEEFFEFMVEQGKKISKKLPQSEYYKALREQELANLFASMIDDERVFAEPEYDFAIIYDPERKVIPSQHRILRIIPVNNIHDAFKLTQKWQEFYDTIGAAIPQKRLLNFANRAGKMGVSNIRVIGTVNLPRLKESWDGRIPILEFYMPNKLRWLTINTVNIDTDIKNVIRTANTIFEATDK